jgi:hypothetical protein
VSTSDWSGAIADFTSALDLDPQRADTYVSRGWARLVASRDGADDDARAYLNLRRGDRYAAYMAILGALGARRAGRDAEADAFLDAGLAGIASPRAWPAPILRYLKHTLSLSDLLATAADDAQAAEAHALAGLDLLFAGFKSEAIEHLRAVRDCTRGRGVALELARATLERIDGTSPLPEPIP